MSGFDSEADFWNTVEDNETVWDSSGDIQIKKVGDDCYELHIINNFSTTMSKEELIKNHSYLFSQDDWYKHWEIG